MLEFKKRMGIPASARLFSINSQDEHLRRALLRLGWEENRLPGSIFFDLKWVYTDVPEDYRNLSDGQYLNHFRNNTELTTKGRLLVNLAQHTSHKLALSHYYPTSYDLGNDVERGNFVRAFELNSLYCLIKQHVRYFK